MALKFRTAAARDYRGLKLVALLFVAVLVPSACVLWFMNEAVEHQATASRASLAEAYRGQLRLLRSRLDASWQSRVAALEADLPRSAAPAFHKLVTSGAADSVIVLARDGTPAYPSLVPATEVAAASAESVTARAAQAVVRDLMQKGEKRAAAETIHRQFTSGRAAPGLDPDGRLIAADQQLLLIQLLAPSDPRRRPAVERLTGLVNDYARSTLPSAQRLFLMQQVQALGAKSSDFPTLDAERLAVAFLETERPTRAGSGLQPTSLGDVWQASSPGDRVVALYRTSTVMNAMRALLGEQDSDAIEFQVIPPGAPNSTEAIAIGPALPGWELSFVSKDGAAVADSARRRRTSYGVIAMLAIGAVLAAAAMLGNAARRQARLASLRTDLVSAVSHELKTPLASMRLLVDALLDDERVDPVKTREYLHLMSVENARLSRLIENFLTFSRLERGRHQFEFKPTNPSEVVREALAALPEGRRGDRAPAIEIAPDLPSIRADQDALATVLLNLLDNAYKYSPADPRVTLRAFRDADHVVFAVEDNGIGIPGREHKRIFKRFYRVDRRLARDTAGSGLGLSIVDAIVRAHGGSVRVRSRPAQGSTFAVYLPCAPDGAVV